MAMIFDAPFWIFPLLPIVLTLLCAGAVYWALSQMAPLGNRPRLATPTPPHATYAPAVSAAAPPVRSAVASDNATLATLLDTPTAVSTPARDILLPADDDLTVVEGIGPHIATVLAAAGIPTLSALAKAEPAQLERVLRDAGLNLAQPDTWPEQARLAASGRMEELERLQERLRAGRQA
jgi:predicted flap endonuclease-1-like 5' DNA nuclease